MTTTARPTCLPGEAIVRLMRTRRISIRRLAGSMNVTQKRVRQVRRDGVVGDAFVRDWLEALKEPSEAGS